MKLVRWIVQFFCGANDGAEDGIYRPRPRHGSGPINRPPRKP